MAEVDPTLTARRWDTEYRRGRYLDEPPLPFVAEMLTVLRERAAVGEGIGLYVGCGNGRNYLPLVEAGLHLYGLDLSWEALSQLRARRPGQPLPLICGDFRTFPGARPFDYLIALQVFQHGGAGAVATYFANAGKLLKRGGLLFVRVNSVSTEIYHAHTIIERSAGGGLTVEYRAGPKHGLPVHFYSREELLLLTQESFDPVMAPREQIIVRTPPQTGFWAQWEGIWRRR